ncbi:hypothetical protein AWN90_19240 [Nocardia terpenica]|uniref:Uncharacterized protein n=2 Tax=Nocardia terpenica TaxID=455432 RepID=A0A161Z6C8_9NOCA|nr:hypothetical protein AWN90_19240 [Nocardia terpenica]
MAGALRSGGALLLDIPDTRDITSDVSYVTENGGLTRDGLRVAIVDEVHVSLAHRLRRWRTTMTIDGTVYGFERTSHLIQLEEVRSDLKACGFDEVKTLEIRNIRDNFISLLAIKL